MGSPTTDLDDELEPLSTDEALALQGSGWDGDLVAMRDQDPLAAW